MTRQYREEDLHGGKQDVHICKSIFCRLSNNTSRILYSTSSKEKGRWEGLARIETIARALHVELQNNENNNLQLTLQSTATQKLFSVTEQQVFDTFKKALRKITNTFHNNWKQSLTA